MVKKKIIAVSALVILCTLSLFGCGNFGYGNPQKDLKLYGRFKDMEYTEDKFNVDCDWDGVNPFLDKCEYEKYGLYTTPLHSSFRDWEERLNAIALNSYSSTDKSVDATTPGSVEISYGIQACNSVESKNHVGERYFTEPMIQICLYNPDVYKDSPEPDYILGYRAVYSLDGELALEEGKWFLDEDKDEFCRRYFEIMLKVIGKDNK